MVRICENSQLYEVAVLHTDVRKETYKGILKDEYLDTLNYPYVYEKWVKFKKKDDRELLIYEEDGEILGFVAFTFRNMKTECSEILNLHVKSKARRKGIGRKLIGAAASCLEKNGISRLHVCMVKGNVNAERFYKSLGAVEIGEFTELWGDWEVPQKRLVWENISEISDKSEYGFGMFDYNDLTNIMNKEFVLFGAGEYCDAFFKQFPNCKPLKIYDNDSKKWGTFKNGIPIEKPEIHDNVIITCCFYSEIRKQLIEMKCRNISEFYPWHDYSK